MVEGSIAQRWLRSHSKRQGIRLGSVRCQSPFIFYLSDKGPGEEQGLGPLGGKMHRGRKRIRICNADLRCQRVGGHYVPGTVPSKGFTCIRFIITAFAKSQDTWGQILIQPPTLLCDLEPITAPLWTSVLEELKL